MVTRLTALRTNEKEMTIRAEIEALRSMTVGRLRERYAEVFGEPSRSYNKQFLFRRVAWRIQALAEGGLSERARQRALEIANDADLRSPTKGPLAALRFRLPASCKRTPMRSATRTVYSCVCSLTSPTSARGRRRAIWRPSSGPPTPCSR